MKTILLTLLICHSVTAAKIDRSQIKKYRNHTIRILKILNTNSLHSEYKYRALKKIGKKALPALKKIYSDESVSFKNRWISLMYFARIAGKKEGFKSLVAALGDRQWFIRSAAAKALGYMNSKRSVPYLIKVMKNDRSLVVRTSAVDALSQLKATRAFRPMIKCLYDPKNFYKGKVLWIRGHIVDAITRIDKTRATRYLLSMLDDQDKVVVKKVVAALERITGRSHKGITIAQKIDKWKFYKRTNGQFQKGNMSIQFIKK
jgi:HEAT repeat protein